MEYDVHGDHLRANHAECHQLLLSWSPSPIVRSLLN
jgi:hypothetical protein